ncbi:LysR family transcriptional regulator [Granulosicoccus antarcticus]|uniref:HTH-type transcriptional regulator DmlR n=1 Tax=Granulosicoccus antarcticus IMCC3135 TaxID=1192854 RepID=A0A2Z2NUX1_9GAMM|nr:LysR family transcriptional regulator [Granulosicoccus antarcticus]ASJ70904.1 HTH-type transcriptional regulator DmlR [Granulosicoccus antarcticus IMCC3135]
MIDVLTGMRVFVCVVESGSFSGAAEKLDLSRGMTSRYLAQIESHLGVRLLNRTTRKLSMTAVGQDYYQRAVQVLGLVDEAQLAASSEVIKPQGTLRINAPLSFSTHHLGEAITTYLQRFPDIKVDLSLADREVNLVEEGFDLALRISRRIDPALIARPITQVRVIACASPAYIKEHGFPESPEELQQHNCLTYAHSSSSGEWHFQQNGQQCSVPIKGNMHGNNGDMLCSAAVAGLGIVLQPTFLLYKLLQTGQLVRVLPDWEAHSLHLYAVYSNRQFLPLKLRSFIDFLVGHFGENPVWDAEL